MTVHRGVSTWVRWLTFNGVGLLGMAVQLTLLDILTRLAGIHYLPATALAVEITVLHNFLWHQRWTWRDRPAPSVRASAARLAWFHLVNGSVSLCGNLAIVALLTGRAGLHPVLANVVSVAACSFLNFFGAHTLVFASRLNFIGGHRLVFRSRPSRALCAAAVVLGATVVPLNAASSSESPVLQQATLAAWQGYERQVDDRYERATGSAFFAGDTFGGSPHWRREAVAGGTPMFQVRSPLPGAPEPDVPDGRIHHWVGAIFVPRVTVDEVIRYLLGHAGQESGSYDDVIASRLIARDGERVRVFLKLRRTKVITATYNTEHSVEYRRLGGQRASSRSVATRIAELADAGTAGEREKAQGTDSGYLWRLNAYWRYEQTPNGVLIECESVSLSRGIPSLLRPFVSGIVEGVARESLERTLVSLRRVLTRTS
jgi:putative flippase GtrA